MGRRITFTAKGVVEVLPFEEGVPQEGQVLVESVATAISPGTELSRLYDFHMAPRPYPQNTGYLTVARVVKAGAGVNINNMNGLFIVNMGHLSHLCVPAKQLIPVPEGVDAESAAFTNLMSVSLRAVRQAEIQLGSSVLIFGLGLIGQFVQLFARLNGATRIAAIDPSQQRRELATQTGLINVLNPSDQNLASKLKHITGDGRFQTVFDSTGVASVVSDLPQYVQDFGSLLILGGVHKPVLMDLYTHVQKRSLRLIGAGSPDPHNYPFHTEEKNQTTILDLLQSGVLNIKPLITHVEPVSKAPEMYRMLQEEKDKGLGVVFHWQ